MWFWSEISRMFLSMFLGLIILRLKKCVFYRYNNGWSSSYVPEIEFLAWYWVWSGAECLNVVGCIISILGNFLKHLEI